MKNLSFVKIICPPVRIEPIHRIIAAVAVGAHAEVLVRQRVDGVPPRDEGVIVPCTHSQRYP